MAMFSVQTQRVGSTDAAPPETYRLNPVIIGPNDDGRTGDRPGENTDYGVRAVQAAGRYAIRSLDRSDQRESKIENVVIFRLVTHEAAAAACNVHLFVCCLAPLPVYDRAEISASLYCRHHQEPSRAHAWVCFS